MNKRTLSFNNAQKAASLSALSGILALSLVGCGGDSSSGTTTQVTETEPASATFSESATWTVTDFTPGTDSCYDFETQQPIDCTSLTWDIRLENQPRGIKLWSNSGNSGSGKGGVFGLLDWSDLSRYTNATIDPDSGRDISGHYNEDKSGGVFDAEPWFEYNLNGKHQLYPNNRVYLITTDNTSEVTQSSVQQPIYAAQIINYYNDAGVSGYPTIRWIDTALPNQVQTKTINASSNDEWVYLDLTTGTVTSDKNSTWHVGFKRNDIILNGGDSGSQKVGGYLAATPDGYYDQNKEPITSKFTTDGSQATLSNLTQTADYNAPTSAYAWVIDSNGSDLNPTYTGNYPLLDFGWYVYNGSNHQLTAKPIDSAKGALVRSAEGNSYARIRLDEITYPDASSTTPTSWTFKLDIQPAQ